MDDRRIGRTILVLRQRRGWRQADLAARSGVSQSTVSMLERGRIDRFTLGTVRRVLAAFDASGDLSVNWGGHGELDRVLDADHARLMEAWAERHRAAGWEVWVEASFSVYGERGRIDLLAFHRPSGTLEVAEGKTGIWDVQDVLGRLDAKVRLAASVAARRGWRPRRSVGALVIADGRTARRRVAAHRELFAGYSLRGRSALAWLKDPVASAGGVLVFIPLPPTNHGGLRRAGQRRVRLSTRSASATDARSSQISGSDIA